MLNDQMNFPSSSSTTDHHQHHQDQGDANEYVRDIHALTPPPSRNLPLQSSSFSIASNDGSSTENFTSMSREFSALVLAASAAAERSGNQNDVTETGNDFGRIREEESPEQNINALAIVPDNSTLDQTASSSMVVAGNSNHYELSVEGVKKEETESKIKAWETAKIAKINNRFKREDAIINGWENEMVQKSSSGMKKVERKLEEKRVKAQEKMQNDIAKARRKAEERRASAEAKRGTKVAQILEAANFMRVARKPPVKRSFF